MQAKDIMTVEVLTVGPDTGVAEIAEAMVKHRISALPVVDADDRVLGIVSEGDLMRRAEIGTEKHRSWWLRLFSGGSELASEFAKSHGVKASEVMTANPITVAEDASLDEIAELLESRHIKRVPVLHDGKLAGIVSRANLIQALTALKEQVVAIPSSDDRLIREAVTAVIGKEDWAAGARLNVVVTKGVVHLWGLADSAEQEKALVVAAENVPGVAGVENHMALMPSHYGAE